MKKPILATCILALIITGNTIANAQNVTMTIAGTGNLGYSGNGTMGYLANTNAPTDVCMDAANNIYIADFSNGVIRKISARTGIISVYAGGGTSTNDGVQATTAILSPLYMCIDAAGNIYTTTVNQVRKITAATGIITTVAGSGLQGYSGDGGAATNADLNIPAGICIDRFGNIYIVDGGGASLVNSSSVTTYIRKITAATGIISTLAGTSTPGYSGDGGPATAAQIQNSIAICVNAAGDVFFSDQLGSISLGGAYIRKISAANGFISTFAGTGSYPADGDGGPAAAACLGNIYGICTDSTGNIYIDDISCSCRKIDIATGIINTVAGSISIDGYNGDDQNALLEQLSWPYGLFVDKTGNILIADHNNYRVRKAIQLTHTPSFAYGNGEFINACSGNTFSLDTLMMVTDIDNTQTETWTVTRQPQHGILTGFPKTASSAGVTSVSLPLGTNYMPIGTYTGIDSFKVKVSDGSLSSIVTVYVVASRSCSDTGGLVLQVNALSVASTISLFPNPASSVVNIEWSDMHTGDMPFVITDITGNTIYKTAVTDNNTGKGAAQVNVSALPAGIYFLTVNGTEVKKFVKE